MASGKKPGGRKAGTPNKITKAFRESVLAVHSKLGGEAFMLTWAKENPTKFYRIAARMIPTELTGSATGGVTVLINRGVTQDDTTSADPDAPTVDAEPQRTH